MDFSKIARTCSSWMGSSTAFIFAFLLIVLWAIAGPFLGFSETWQLVANTFTTLITFLSVFLIQNAQNHDTRAINTKLDQLIANLEQADNRFISIEEEGEEVLDELSQELMEVKHG